MKIKLILPACKDCLTGQMVAIQNFDQSYYYPDGAFCTCDQCGQNAYCKFNELKENFSKVKMKFPKHINMTISHNTHKSYYMKIANYIKDYPHMQEYINSPEYQKSLDTDELWEIQLYPHTPISFYWVAASTFEKAMELLWETCDD